MEIILKSKKYGDKICIIDDEDKDIITSRSDDELDSAMLREKYIIDNKLDIKKYKLNFPEKYEDAINEKN